MSEALPPSTLNMSKMKSLPENFAPGKDDVICGRGKKCYNHIGNNRFRERVERTLDEYRKAHTKLDKSNVLNKVIDEVRAASGVGGFVKQDSAGCWYEVGDFLAREKTSQAFRDALSESYKSSSVSKKKKREQEVKVVVKSETPFLGDEFDLASRLNRLRAEKGASIEQVHFNRANMELLSRINHQAERHSSGGFDVEDSLVDLINAEDPMTRFNGEYFKAPIGRGGKMHTASEVITRSRFPESDGFQGRSSRDYFPESYTEDDNREQELEIADLHHSMPEMGWSDHLHGSMPSLDFAAPQRSKFESMNASMPNMRVNEFQYTMDSHNIEPSGFEHTDVMRFARGMIPSFIDEQSNYFEEDPTISCDIIACLEERLTDSYVDSNPFEPIPLETIAHTSPLL